MNIFYTKQSMKNIKTLDKSMRLRVKEGIEKIPSGDIVKLQGYSNLYRLRIGNYRIIYQVFEEDITIYAILPRGNAYKQLWEV